MKILSSLFRRGAPPAAVPTVTGLPRTVADIEAELDRKRARASRRPFRALGAVDTGRLAAFLATEHPQTVALVLAHLESAKQLDVLKALPESLRPELVVRMASMQEVSDERLDELEALVAREIARAAGEASKPAQSVGAVEDLVLKLDPQAARSLVGELALLDPVLGEALRARLDGSAN